ncbi:MAG: ATPase, T2SS/T4P/T4SS family [Planctomycetota bacterium]
MAVEEVQLWQTVAPVDFSPKAGSNSEAQALLISTRQNPGYAVASGQVSHAIQSRATHVLMDYSQSACAIRYQIDGSWESLPPIDRETGDGMLYALKQLCHLNPADRRTAQSGSVTAKLAKEKFEVKLQSQGVPTGERVLVKLDSHKVPFETMADLGMRDNMITQFKEKLNEEQSLILVTSPKGQGLTTTWNVAMNVADKFIRDFQSFEDQSSPEPEVINVTANFFGGDTGQTEISLLQKMLLKEPDVMVFPEMPEPDTLELAMGQVENLEKQVITRMVAGSAIAGLTEMLSRYSDQRKSIAKHLGGVLGQRLVRRLCENCKVGYEPSPQLLQQLGIPPGRVAMLYQPFVLPPPEQQVDENGNPAPMEPCPHCNGRGFLGRVAIFEWLVPGENLRKAMETTQDAGQLAAAAKADGHRNLQGEAVMTVARGLTSLDELKRAFAKG